MPAVCIRDTFNITGSAHSSSTGVFFFFNVFKKVRDERLFPVCLMSQDLRILPVLVGFFFYVFKKVGDKRGYFLFV